MILLLWHYRLPWWALLLGAISFAFYSQFILWMYHKWLGAMIWGPYLVWALLKYRQQLINIPACVFLAFLWRTGHLQACVFGFMIVACIWLSFILPNNEHRPSFRDIFRITLSCLLTGIFGALLTLDVFVDTLQRLEGCKEMPLEWGLFTPFTVGAMLIPTSLGMPETMDIGKVFGQTLFDIKFGGGIVFILSLIACFNKRAPREAKILFIVSYVSICTPLMTYLYSRSTLVMALGMSWLAAWQLYDFTKNQYCQKYLRRIFIALLTVSAIWLAASVICYVFKDSIYELLLRFTESKTQITHICRASWQAIRLEQFVERILIWDWRNILLCSGLVAGSYCLYSIRPGKKNTFPIYSVVLITYMELFIFSTTWITYSTKPSGPYLYNEPTWMAKFRNHVKDGSVVQLNPTSDVDFLINNILSGFDIRLADGYETFRPNYIHPLKKEFDTKEYAKAGISHVISNTKWCDVNLPGWDVVMIHKDFKVWANPDYKGRYLVNQDISIRENWRTYNKINLCIPVGASSLTVLESYHKGWSAIVDNQELSITPTEQGGMYIELPKKDSAYNLLLEFRMPYRWLCYYCMLLTAIGLTIVAIYRKIKLRNDKPYKLNS